MSTFATPSATTPLPIFAFAVVAGKYYALAGLTLLIFDHLSTLDREIDRIWNTRFTAASLLFYLNRYFSLIVYFAYTVALFDPTWSIKTCEKFITLQAVTTIVTQGVISLVMLLRTYALWSRKRYILAILVVGYVMAMSFIVRANIAGRRYEPEQPIYAGCLLIVPGRIKLNPLVHAWFALIGYDALILVLTLWKTITISRLGGTMPLTSLLMRDGMMYFLVITIANISYFGVYVTTIPVNMTVAHSLSSIMTSRLILNLRHESSRNVVGDTSYNNNSQDDKGITGPGGAISTTMSWNRTMMSDTLFTNPLPGSSSSSKLEGGGGGCGKALPALPCDVDARRHSESSFMTESPSYSRRGSLGHSGEGEADEGQAGLLRRKSSDKSSRRIAFFPLGNFGGPLDAGKGDETEKGLQQRQQQQEQELVEKAQRTSLSKPELAV